MHHREISLLFLIMFSSVLTLQSAFYATYINLAIIYRNNIHRLFGLKVCICESVLLMLLKKLYIYIGPNDI